VGARHRAKDGAPPEVWLLEVANAKDKPAPVKTKAPTKPAAKPLTWLNAARTQAEVLAREAEQAWRATAPRRAYAMAWEPMGAHGSPCDGMGAHGVPYDATGAHGVPCEPMGEREAPE